MRVSRIALGAVVVSVACLWGGNPAHAQQEDAGGTAPVSSEAQAAAARKVVLEYKGGEIFPLRILRGVDLLEPLLPFAAAERGDWGRLFYNTAVPYALAGSAIMFRSKDKDTLKEVGRWKWVGIDEKSDNEPMQFGLLALGALSIFLPSPEDGDDYSWQLRADRMAVFGIGMLVTELESRVLKHVLHRMRPDGSDKLSRPSGHASSTAAAMTFMANVLRDCFRPQDEDRFLHRIWKEVVCGLLYLGVAYICLERVHAKKHYLSDTLLGAAIGTFTMHMLYSWSFLREELGGSWLSMASVGYNSDMKGIEFSIKGEF